MNQGENFLARFEIESLPEKTKIELSQELFVLKRILLELESSRALVKTDKEDTFETYVESKLLPVFNLDTERKFKSLKFDKNSVNDLTESANSNYFTEYVQKNNLTDTIVAFKLNVPDSLGASEKSNLIRAIDFFVQQTSGSSNLNNTLLEELKKNNVRFIFYYNDNFSSQYLKEMIETPDALINTQARFIFGDSEKQPQTIQ